MSNVPDYRGMRTITWKDVPGSLTHKEIKKREAKRPRGGFVDPDRMFNFIHYIHYGQRVREAKRIRRAARHVNRKEQK